MIGSFDVYLTIAESADRPYVSTTPPSDERLKIAKDNGWKVYRIRISHEDDRLFVAGTIGLVETRDRLV